MTGSSWEDKSSRELDAIIEQCKTLASRVRTQGALAKCTGEEASLFSPAQQAADRLDQAATILADFLVEGPDKDTKVVSSCVGRLMRSFGFSGNDHGQPEVSERPKPTAYDPGEFSAHSHALSVPEMLEFLSIMNKTGMLEVATDDEHFALELQNGEIVHATSTNAPESERLGEVLVSQGLLTRVQLEKHLNGASTKEKLGHALQASDAVSKEQLAAALSQQIKQLFRRLFDAQDAYFIFREGKPQNDEAGVHMNVTSLLLQSATQIDENEHSLEELMSEPESLAGEGAEDAAPSEDEPDEKAETAA